MNKYEVTSLVAVVAVLSFCLGMWVVLAFRWIPPFMGIFDAIEQRVSWAVPAVPC